MTRMAQTSLWRAHISGMGAHKHLLLALTLQSGDETQSVQRPGLKPPLESLPTPSSEPTVARTRARECVDI